MTLDQPTHYSRYARILYPLMLALLISSPALRAEDARQLVPMPALMQAHMLDNMRDHLATLNQILALLADGRTDAAGQLAEHKLGMSSLQAHGASHMAKLMPAGMRAAGTAMHRAASRFALVVQEGDSSATLQALHQVTSSCVACHAAYRIH